MRRASYKQITAWRKSEELEVRFGVLMAAWRASFKAATVRGGYPSPSIVRGFSPLWVDQVQRYWERPEHVSNPRLNGTLVDRGRHVNIAPTVLGVASEPEAAGFRLCTVLELKEAHDAARFAAIEESRQATRRGRGMAV